MKGMETKTGENTHFSLFHYKIRLSSIGTQKKKIEIDMEVLLAYTHQHLQNKTIK